MLSEHDVDAIYGNAMRNASRKLSPFSREVLAAIAVYANTHDRGFAWPSQETITQLVGCSASTVKRAVKDLEAAGELELRRSHGGPARPGKRQTSLYKPAEKYLEVAVEHRKNLTADLSNQLTRDAFEAELAAREGTSATLGVKMTPEEGDVEVIRDNKAHREISSSATSEVNLTRKRMKVSPIKERMELLRAEAGRDQAVPVSEQER